MAGEGEAAADGDGLLRLPEEDPGGTGQVVASCHQGISDSSHYPVQYLKVFIRYTTEALQNKIE